MIPVQCQEFDSTIPKINKSLLWLYCSNVISVTINLSTSEPMKISKIKEVGKLLQKQTNKQTHSLKISKMGDHFKDHLKCQTPTDFTDHQCLPVSPSASPQLPLPRALSCLLWQDKRKRFQTEVSEVVRFRLDRRNELFATTFTTTFRKNLSSKVSFLQNTGPTYSTVQTKSVLTGS